MGAFLKMVSRQIPFPLRPNKKPVETKEKRVKNSADGNQSTAYINEDGQL